MGQRPPRELWVSTEYGNVPAETGGDKFWDTIPMCVIRPN